MRDNRQPVSRRSAAVVRDKQPLTVKMAYVVLAFGQRLRSDESVNHNTFALHYAAKREVQYGR